MGLGGNYLTQRLIVERLDRSLFTPIVLAPMEGIALKKFRDLGVECIVLPPTGDLAQYGGTILRFSLFRKARAIIDIIHYNLKVAALLRIRKIDVIYANCVRAEILIGLAARITSTPSLLYIKGQLANPIIDRICFVLARKILFFSKLNRDDRYPALVYRFRKKIDILKIGLEPSTITSVAARDMKALKAELKTEKNYINIVLVGQLYSPKGQHLALEAIARLIRQFPKLRLYLLGDHVLDEYKPYKTELEQIVRADKLYDNVCFAGARSDALDIISIMDILIHPSLAEGFGRAVLEAMALGKPVIASRVGGLREAIQNGRNGFLIDPGDVDALAARLRELIIDPLLRERMGQAARETVFSEYLIDDKVTRLTEILSELLCDKV